jgi:hypothetical protein
VCAVAVEDMPLAAVQFYRKIIVIPYGDTIGEHMFSRHRITVVGLVKSLNVNFNSLRNFIGHGNRLYKIKKI